MSIRLSVLLVHACAVVSVSAQVPTWSLSSEPTFTVGQLEGQPEYLLSRVEHVRSLANGNIVVTIGPDIRFYNARGTYVGKAGGRGRGPGEFQYIHDLRVLPGDTLLALGNGEKVWLTAQGKFIRQERLTRPNTSEWTWLPSASLLPNGSLLALQRATSNNIERGASVAKRPAYRYAILNTPAGTVQPLVKTAGLRQIVLASGEPAVQPFSPHAQHAVGFDRVYVGDNDTTLVSAFALDGKPLGTVQVADNALPVTRRDLQRYRDRTFTMIGDNTREKAMFEREWAAVPKPARFPYWGRAIVDRDGNLWISDPERLQEAPTGWSVFDVDGRRIARVALPGRFTPKEIGNDYVLGVSRDEFNVEYVRKYSLRRVGR